MTDALFDADPIQTIGATVMVVVPATVKCVYPSGGIEVELSTHEVSLVFNPERLREMQANVEICAREERS